MNKTPFYKSKKFIAMAVAVAGFAITASLGDITWHDAATNAWKVVAVYLLSQGAEDAANAYNPPQGG